MATTGHIYRMSSMFRSHESYPVRRTVTVNSVEADQVHFTCVNDELRWLPTGQFANQYFDVEGCDLDVDAEIIAARGRLARQ